MKCFTKSAALAMYFTTSKADFNQGMSRILL